MRSLSVVTVSYNDSAAVKDLIRSIRSSLTACAGCIDSVEVVVVDNNSRSSEAKALDNMAKELGGENVYIKIIHLRKNYGYSGGVNAGVAVAKGDVVAVSNPDIMIEERFITDLTQFYERIGGWGEKLIVAPKILLGKSDIINSTGMSMHPAGYGILNNLGRSAWDKAVNMPGLVLAPHGAFFIGYKRVLEELGPFDPTYFSFLEDLDLGLRAYASGYLVYYVPSLVVRHYWGMTWGRGLSPTKYFYTERNRLVTLMKNVPTDLLVAAVPSIALSEAVSLAYALLNGFPRKKAEVYASIVSLLRSIIKQRRAIVGNRSEALRASVLALLTDEFVHTEFPSALVRAVNKLYAAASATIKLMRR